MLHLPTLTFSSGAIRHPHLHLFYFHIFKNFIPVVSCNNRENSPFCWNFSILLARLKSMKAPYSKLLFTFIACCLLLVVVSGHSLAFATTQCTTKCSVKKSKDYQKCRNIPLNNRALRVKCFQRADSQFSLCISKCK